MMALAFMVSMIMSTNFMNLLSCTGLAETKYGHFDILGLAAAEATDETVRATCRSLAVELHPDRVRNNTQRQHI